jgi:hypothetical protein
MEPQELLSRLKEIDKQIAPGPAKTLMEALALDIFIESWGGVDAVQLEPEGTLSLPQPAWDPRAEVRVELEDPDASEGFITSQELAEMLEKNSRDVRKMILAGVFPGSRKNEYGFWQVPISEAWKVKEERERKKARAQARKAMEETVSVLPVKRGPGRPRKYPL